MNLEMRTPSTSTRDGIARGAGHLGISIEEYVAQHAAGNLWCSGCQDWLPADRFGLDRARKSGRNNRCRDCLRAYWREYRSGIVTVRGGS